MERLTEQIMEHLKRLPEGTPVAAKGYGFNLFYGMNAWGAADPLLGSRRRR